MQYVLTWKICPKSSGLEAHTDRGSYRERYRQACQLPAVHSQLCCFGQLLDIADRQVGQGQAAQLQLLF